jgi:hypothetical protein
VNVLGTKDFSIPDLSAIFAVEKRVGLLAPVIIKILLSSIFESILIVGRTYLRKVSVRIYMSTT